MTKTFDHEFSGRVLNPDGVEIALPFWAFKRLKKLHLLSRDPKTGKRRIRARVFTLMEIWEAPEFPSNHRLEALPLDFCSGSPNDGGTANRFLKTLGRDCSGLS